MRDALLIQQCLSIGDYTGKWSGIFYDMLRLTIDRHAAYCRAHGMDYRVMFGDAHPGKEGGAWDKVVLILEGLRAGYEYVAWLDTDAAIWDMDCDLRAALPEGVLIGAVVHDPARSEYLKACKVDKHINVGVLYVKNDPRVIDFFEKWLASWPGDPRWKEQGTFNQLAAGCDFIAAVEDRWNATVNVNMVDNPAVMGWHGIMPPERRLAMMQAALADDFIRFRVR